MSDSLTVDVHSGFYNSYLTDEKKNDASFMVFDSKPTLAWCVAGRSDVETSVALLVNPTHDFEHHFIKQKQIKIAGVLLDPSTTNIRTGPSFYHKRKGLLTIQGVHTLDHVEGPVAPGDLLVARLPESQDVDPITKKHYFPICAKRALTTDDENLFVGVALGAVPEGTKHGSVPVNIRPYL